MNKIHVSWSYHPKEWVFFRIEKYNRRLCFVEIGPFMVSIHVVRKHDL